MKTIDKISIFLIVAVSMLATVAWPIKAIKDKFGEDYKYMWIPVNYVDPYHHNPEIFSVYFCKHFRYAYQMEQRFLMIPKHEKDVVLEPFFIELGSLEDIAKFYFL